MPTLRTHWPRVLLLSGLLLAFFLRLHRLGAESLWYDETVSAYLAAQSIPDLIAHTSRDIHPPGYYLLLHFWQMWTTPTLAHGLEFLYAWPSLWFGMVSIALLAALVRQYAAAPAAAIAVLLAAVNPFQVMYAQEVRMYTVGTTCVLITLWAAGSYLRAVQRRPGSTRHTRGLLILYSGAAIIGLYTLYYFLFWLAVLVPVITVILYRDSSVQPTARRVRPWLLAQLAVLVGWLPWLPIFLRQAIDPPVPPWRVPWTSPQELIAAAAEALAAPLVGQSPPAALNALWATLVLFILVAFVVYTKNTAQASSESRWVLPTLFLGPALLIFAISLTLTPLYHVRYLVTYAVLFPLIAALLIDRLRHLRAVAVLTLLILTGVSAVALAEFWRVPDLRADDHRTAVATLAQNWRPGDAILVNAGWVYTVLSVYWPDELSGPVDAIPPAIEGYPRLTHFTEQPAAHSATVPIVIRSGSIDAPDSLGWGHPDSDFFAISAADTQAALDVIANAYARLWHYRLYDTVNDPTGLIRDTLASYGEPFFSATIPGPSYLRLEGYDLAGPVPDLGTTTGSATFGQSVHLSAAQAPATVAAGSYLYIVTSWDDLSTEEDGPLSTSLRLYAQDGALAAQADTPLPSQPTSFTQTLALPIPAATAPGPYTLELIVYWQSDLTPLPAEPPSPLAPAARLLEVEVTLPAPAARE